VHFDLLRKQNRASTTRIVRQIASGLVAWSRNGYVLWMQPRLPRTVVGVAFATLLPFLFCAGAVLATTDSRAAGWMAALLAYGAVVLALFGGVHWGSLLFAAEPRPAGRLRLALGVVPALVGWATLLITLVLPGEVGLCLLIVGYAAFAFSETRLYQAELLSRDYMWLRWGHTLAVVTVLAALLALRLLGAHLVL
jgi:hypothetical protein